MLKKSNWSQKSKSEPIISFKKKKSGDLFFELDLRAFLNIKQLIKFLLSILLYISNPVFRFFDFLASKRKLVISAVGLGLGLGLSVLVTQRPDALQAFPELINNNARQIEVSSLKIETIDLYTEVKKGSVVDVFNNLAINYLIHDDRSGNLGSKQPLVIASMGNRDILENLQAVEIGNEIILIGSNNGVYKYRVIEIRDAHADNLPAIISSQDNSLIVYKPTNFLRTKIYAVVARPINF
jgi:hypothetical protein